MTLSQESRTAKLWLLHIYYLDVLNRFIIAERTSNWLLHIDSTLIILNLFTLSGYVNHAKSATVYNQQMQSLAEDTLGYMKSLLLVFIQPGAQIVCGVACGGILSLN